MPPGIVQTYLYVVYLFQVGVFHLIFSTVTWNRLKHGYDVQLEYALRLSRADVNHVSPWSSAKLGMITSPLPQHKLLPYTALPLYIFATNDFESRSAILLAK